MSLDAQVEVTVGAFALDVSLTATAGETVAVLGPNGAGKSTLLRCLAGLTALERGSVVLDGRTLDDPAAGVRVAPQERAVGMVFQQHLLFPSMSLVENVAFGPRSQGVAKADARRRARELLELVGLGDRVTDRPSALSGGQSQRVALARALAIEPRLVLLDEPLAALDVTTRAEIRRELRTHLERLGDCVRILVTHDPVDAYALADRVVVLESGRVTQSGTLAEVTGEPRTQYLADLVGLNLLDGAVWPTGSVPADVLVAVHPRDVVVSPGDAGPGSWPAIVRSIDLERDRARVRLAGPVDLTAEIDASTLVTMTMRPGDTVAVSVAPSALRVYSKR